MTSQHTEADQLLARLESGHGDRAAVFAELADKLAAHCEIEERIFYPAAMKRATADQLHEAVEEHLSVKRLLADMLALDVHADKDSFDAKLSVLKEQLSHHAHEEEEQTLFLELRRSMSADERAGLGNECLVMFETLMTSSPRRQIPNETAAAAKLPA
nr:hemerythrin domain-containing protein [Kofleriaceae bacterium]